MGRVVSVVVVTWNSAPFLRRCLDGIDGQSWPERERIAVDNGSTDATREILRGRVDQLIENETNRGFSAAVNQALALAKGELVLLCNPDAFLEPEYIARLADAFDAAGDDFGMATGKLLRASGAEIRPTNVVDSKGIRMTRTGRHFDIGQGEGDDDSAAIGLRPLAISDWRLAIGTTAPQSLIANRQSLYEVFGVSGAAALYRASFLHDVAVDGEVFDEDFFTYREDADLAWRGRLLGWRALYVPDAVGYHVRTVTPERRRKLPAFVNLHGVKNRFLLRLKNEGLGLALRNAPFELARDVIAVAAVLTVERTSLPGLVWIWRNRKRMLAKRRAIQRRRKVPDRALAEWFR